MFISPAIIIVLFKITTLIVLLVFTSYAYKRYIRPTLQDITDDIRNSYTYMVKTTKALDQQQQEIASQMQQSEEETQILMQKIAVWKTAVEQDREKQMQGVAESQMRFLQAYQERQSAYVDEKMRALLLMQALDEAEQDCRGRYQNTKEATPYIKKLINSLRIER